MEIRRPSFRSQRQMDKPFIVTRSTGVGGSQQVDMHVAHKRWVIKRPDGTVDVWWPPDNSKERAKDGQIPDKDKWTLYQKRIVMKCCRTWEDASNVADPAFQGYDPGATSTEHDESDSQLEKLCSSQTRTKTTTQIPHATTETDEDTSLYDTSQDTSLGATYSDQLEDLAIGPDIGVSKGLEVDSHDIHPILSSEELANLTTKEMQSAVLQSNVEVNSLGIERSSTSQVNQAGGIQAIPSEGAGCTEIAPVSEDVIEEDLLVVVGEALTPSALFFPPAGQKPSTYVQDVESTSIGDRYVDVEGMQTELMVSVTTPIEPYAVQLPGTSISQVEGAASADGDESDVEQTAGMPVTTIAIQVSVMSTYLEEVDEVRCLEV